MHTIIKSHNIEDSKGGMQKREFNIKVIFFDHALERYNLQEILSCVCVGVWVAGYGVRRCYYITDQCRRMFTSLPEEHRLWL